AGTEVESLDECTPGLTQHHEDLADARRDLRGAAGPGQAHLRRAVVADHGAVQVRVPVDLRRAEEADVDPPALEPVGEHLGYRDDSVRSLRELAVADREWQLGRLRPDRSALVDQDAVRRVRRAGE